MKDLLESRFLTNKFFVDNFNKIEESDTNGICGNFSLKSDYYNLINKSFKIELNNTRKGNDHVLCNNQFFLVNDFVNEIFLIGIAEWGDFRENLCLINGLQQIEKSFIFKEMHCSEENSWSFQINDSNYCILGKCKTNLNDFFNLSYYHMQVKKYVEKIKLPLNPAIHLFHIFYD